MAEDAETCPWSDLDADGSSLVVHDFLTKRLSTLMSALRREVTLPYARSADLSIVEWRLLSLAAHSGSLPFGELVTQSTSDKAQVSRTVRLLEQRGLVELRPETEASRKKLVCVVTEAGMRVYDEIIRNARRAQAQTLLILSRDERETLFRALEKLQSALGD
jgi:DNA-binding MarR family transcriptional regulator